MPSTEQLNSNALHTTIFVASPITISPHSKSQQQRGKLKNKATRSLYPLFLFEKSNRQT